MKKLQLIVSVMICLQGAGGLYAQVTGDALLFSDQTPMITARSAAIGGAMSALGGDIACLSMNPAGVAIYRNAEIVFTPMVAFGGTRTLFADTTARDNRSSFNIGSFGLVFGQPLDKPRWYGMGFGLSYNRLTSFNQDFKLDGVSYGSRLVTMAANAQGAVPSELNPFEDQLAYDAYLIDNPSSATAYISALTDSNYVRKTQTVQQSGGVNELALAFGMNYQHKLYWGLGIGVDFLNYREHKEYSELEETGTISFKEMRFTEDRRVNGVGLNAKFGLIYRPVHFLRIGASIRTPTVFGNVERYYTALYGRVIYNDTIRENDLTPPAEGLYPHRTSVPFSVGGGVAVLIGKKGKPKKGFISAEVEYLNYRTAVFSLKQGDDDPANKAYIDGLNRDVDALYKGAVSVRAGMEWVYDIFRFRAGYRLRTSPYQTAVEGVSDLRHDISIGVGLRQRHFFLDLAYVHTLRDFEHLPYASTTVLQRAVTRFSGGAVMVTIGVRFGQKLD